MRITGFALGTAFLLTVPGCSEPVATDDRMQLVLQPVAASTSGIVDDFTEAPPVVRAVNALDDYSPVSGVAVNFRPFSPTFGLVAKSWDTTDAQGLASAESWRLGTKAGSQNLLVVAPGVNVATLIAATARPASPTVFTPSVRLKQYVLGSWQPSPPGVRAADRYGNSVSGFAVAFGVVAGSGSIDALSSTTNALGIASAGAWRIPDPEGTYAATATAGATLLNFTAQRVDGGKLVWYRLDSLISLGKSYAAEAYGIDKAEIAFTPFDPCICVDFQGLYFETRDYRNAQSQFREGGLFTIAGRAGRIESGDDVSVSGASLIVSRFDYYYYSVVKWVYSKKP